MPRRVVAAPGLAFMPFEYDLVEALRPRLVVDLGAGAALSFFTYCQSMHDHDIDGICYAVDTWPKDATADPHASFEAINDHGRRFYPGIYYLMKMPPHEARQHFDEGSIDLLRVDGLRPDVIGGADVEAWYRRMRAGGVIAWHGISSQPKLWSLLASRCPTVSFSAEEGLGLAYKPGETPQSQLLSLLFAEDLGSEVERFYDHVRAHHDMRRSLPKIPGAADWGLTTDER